MTPDPYDDDDDQPTLQRQAPVSGAAPKQSGLPARFASGVRVAYKLPEDLEAEAPFLDSAFVEEEDTAVDRKPLEPLPADGERDTATLPIDVAALLLRASIAPDDET